MANGITLFVPIVFQMIDQVVPDRGLNSGVYYVGLLVDQNRVFAETDESNNATFLNVVVNVPTGCP